MTPIKYPLKAKRGDSGVWIEDGNGLSICGFNLLLADGDEGSIFELAEEIAYSYNRLKEPDQTPWTDGLCAQLKKEQKP